MTDADIRHYLIVYDIPTSKAKVRDFATDIRVDLIEHQQRNCVVYS